MDKDRLCGLVAVVTIPIAVPPDQAPRWSEGCLPVEGIVPSPEGPVPLVATGPLRATAFHRRVHRILYPPAGAAGGRWCNPAYRLDPADVPPELTVEAAEILIYDELLAETRAGFLNVHLAATSHDPLATVEALWSITRSRQGREAFTRSALAAAASDSFQAESRTHQNLFTTVFAQLALTEPETPWPPTSVVSRWSARDRWTWFFGSCTPPGRYLPPADADDADLGQTLALSSTWSARVLRDGASMVVVDGAGDPAVASLRLYAQTIYADALLLGNIQRRWLNEMADAVGELAAAAHPPFDTLRRFDRAMIRFRAGVWWSAAAEGSHADRLLRAYQHQHDLPGLLQGSAAELGELLRLARDEVESRTLEANERTSRSVLVLTGLGLPLTAVIGVWQGLGGGWNRLAVAGPAAVVVGVGLLLLLQALAFRRSAPGDPQSAPRQP